jgi:hypothetical protein
MVAPNVRKKGSVTAGIWEASVNGSEVRGLGVHLLQYGLHRRAKAPILDDLVALIRRHTHSQHEAHGASPLLSAPHRSMDAQCSQL